MTFFLRIWMSLGRDKRLIVWSVVFGLVFTALGVIPPLLVRELILSLQSSSAGGGFLLLGLIVAGVYLLRGVTRYLYGVASHVAAYRTQHRLLVQVYRRLQSMSPGFMNRRHSGNLVARSVGDVAQIEDFIAHGIPESFLAIVVPVTMSTVLFVLNWKLALIALFPLPIVAMIAWAIKTRTTNSWRSVRRRFGDLSAAMQDHISGLETIQSFNAQQASLRRIEQESRRYRDNIIRANVFSLMPAGLIEAAAGTGLVGIIVAGMWMTGPSPALRIEVADLVVFLMYLGQILLPLLRLANLTENLQKSAASAERVFELLDEKPSIVEHPRAAVPPVPRFDIEFDRVRFAYEPASPVLRGVSFSIDEGETVALVGMTGVGKSTVCHLLSRSYDVDAGAISIGGVDVRRLPLEFLRGSIAAVSQDAFLFEGTVRENLLLADEHATGEQLAEAARTAGAEDFLRDLPHGYDTMIGERGVRLSGGQKQRIALARALLKGAPILVLDEATSAVDTETEEEIREALHRATIGRTVLVVAHRLSTIRSADRIIVLADGRVVETGSYQELLAADGSFARLCMLQSDALATGF